MLLIVALTSDKLNIQLIKIWAYFLQQLSRRLQDPTDTSRPGYAHVVGGKATAPWRVDSCIMVFPQWKTSLQSPEVPAIFYDCETNAESYERKWNKQKVLNLAYFRM